MERFNVKLVRNGFKGICEVQPTFCNSLHELEEGLVNMELVVNKTTFINELIKFRKVLLLQQQRREEALPKNINPTMF